MENNKISEVKNFSIGSFTVLTSRNLILADGKEISITPKMLAVLIELAKNQGQTLSKEQIILSVWGTLHTSDMVLSRAISDLRKVFSDSARQQRYIETVSKQGYRLKQNVTWLNAKTLATNNKRVENSAEPIENNLLSSATPTAPVASILLKAHTKKIKVIFSFITLIFLLLMTLYFTQAINNDITEENESPSIIITDDAYTKRFVRYSADGKSIAYSVSDNEHEGSKIILQTLVDNQTRFVEQDEASGEKKAVYHDLAPAFSPKGDEIAYKHYSTKSCTVVIENLNNAKKRNVSSCPISKTHALDWSPDGQQLVSTVFNPINNIESLALIDTATGNMSMLPPPPFKASGYLWPRFSPNNKDIAVVYFRPNDHLWTIGTVNVESGVFSDILVSREEVSQVIWDKKGLSLYYLVVGGTNEGIWKIDLATKTSYRTLKSRSSSLDYDVVNDRFVAIERERIYRIWQTYKNSKGELISTAKFEHLAPTHSPSLSPNNKDLAFISSSANLDSLWLNTLATNRNVLLYQSVKNETLSDLSWSPNGKGILITTLYKGQSRILKIDLELGEVSPFESENNVKKGKWSHDGQMLYWYEEIENTWYVIEKNLITQKQRRILNQEISRFDIQDGKQLHYQKIGTTSVHLRRLENASSPLGADKKLLTSIHSFAWDAHINNIYYLAHMQNDKSQFLHSYDVNTGSSTALYPIASSQLTDAGRHLSVNEDGSKAFYTRVDKYRTEIAIIVQPIRD